MASILYKGKQENVSSNLWTPSQISTDAWFDFGDTTTITDTGTLIIADKSGNNRNCSQSNASLKPKKNGDSFYYDGSNDFFSFTTLVPMYSGQSMYVVADTSLISTSDRLFLQRNIINPSPPYPPGIYFGGFGLDYRPCLYWGSGHVAVQPSPRRELLLIRYYIESNQTTMATAVTEVNGGNTVTSSLTGVFPLTNWTEINSSFGSQQSLCWIKEVVLCGSNVDKITGYLAWKHGLSYKLPSNHPYNNAPPYLT
jgi:hypothetical protein